MSREAMKLALEALEERYVGALRDKAMDAIRAALDVPELEPVWIQSNHLDHARREPSMCRLEPTQRLPDFVPLYAAPTGKQSLPVEPVAWMHNMIDGIVVPHRPADLKRHPERWTALYK